MQRVLRRGDERDAILRCYELAREKDYKIFAITDGNQCRSSRDAHHHLKYFRKASGCDNKGLGGHGRADVYKIEGNYHKSLFLGFMLDGRTMLQP